MQVLLIDDHALYRDGISLMLEGLEIPVEVFEASSYESAQTIIDKTNDIELVLLDLDLPGINFIDALQALRQQLPGSSIVILSGTEDCATVEQTLQLGARGYIPKSMTAKAMLSALQLIISGVTYVPATILSNKKTAPNGRSTTRTTRDKKESNPDHGLTPRQYDVLVQLTEGKSNKEIGKVLFLTESTIRVHVAAILRSFNVSNRTQAVRHAVQKVWVSIPE